MNNGSAKYKMKFFVAEGEAISMKAKENLSVFCEKYLDGSFHTEVIDVLTDFEKALEHKIFITPTLLLVEPKPQVTLLGNLRDTNKILTAFRLNSEDP